MRAIRAEFAQWVWIEDQGTSGLRRPSSRPCRLAHSLRCQLAESYTAGVQVVWWSSVGNAAWMQSAAGATAR